MRELEDVMDERIVFQTQIFESRFAQAGKAVDMAEYTRYVRSQLSAFSAIAPNLLHARQQRR